MSKISTTAFSGCPECNGTGWVQLSKEGVEGVVRCDCYRESRVQRLIAKAKIPARYQHCELKNFDLLPGLATQTIELALIASNTFVEEYPTTTPFGLLFVGPQGVGKTHLAVGIIKAMIRRKAVPCLFRAFPELLKEIQSSYSHVSQSSEFALLAPVLETEVLVLDELGSQTPSTWVKDTVSYILNYRYNENKVTIFTTNYQDKEELNTARKGIAYTLAERIGDQMRSRLFEMCKTIKMEGYDFRMHIKGANHQQFKKES